MNTKLYKDFHFVATIHYLDVITSSSQALVVSTCRETNYHVVRPRLVVQGHLLEFDEHEKGVVLTFHGVVQIQQTYKGKKKTILGRLYARIIT